jgi:nitrite reductase/ring-hydroxylating ferredoxin subunit
MPSTAATNGHAKRDLASLIRLDEGEIERDIFVDPAIHAEELERIFARTWLFVAHASEIPSPGDYVTRRTGADPVFVTRTEDDRFQVFLNTCKHRGMQVCRVDRGNTSHFRCPYHGWTYRNDGHLIGVPALKQAYGTLDKDRLSLTAPPPARAAPREVAEADKDRGGAGHRGEPCAQRGTGPRGPVLGGDDLPAARDCRFDKLGVRSQHHHLRSATAVESVEHASQHRPSADRRQLLGATEAIAGSGGEDHGGDVAHSRRTSTSSPASSSVRSAGMTARH